MTYDGVLLYELSQSQRKCDFVPSRGFNENVFSSYSQRVESIDETNAIVVTPLETIWKEFKNSGFRSE